MKKNLNPKINYSIRKKNTKNSIKFFPLPSDKEESISFRLCSLFCSTFSISAL